MIKKGGNGKSTVNKNGVACFHFTASFFHVKRKKEKPKSLNYTFPLFNWFSQWGDFVFHLVVTKEKNKTNRPIFVTYFRVLRYDLMIEQWNVFSLIPKKSLVL